MRIHKLTPTIVSLVVLGVITAALVRYRSVDAQQNRAAQAIATITPIATVTPSQTPGGGVNPVPGPETTRDYDVDLFLDADEVEKRALEEQASDTTTTAALAANPIPVSFKHVALPVRGGIDHAVAGVATRNSGDGVIRLRGVPPNSQLLSALLVWGEIAPAAVVPYNVGFGPDCGVLANVVGSHAFFPTNPAPEPFWFAGGSFFAYLAPVPPAQILPGINGDYRIKGLRSSIRDGRCPWGDGACAGPPLNLPLSEGASLIVIYANQCIPRNAQLFFNLGPSLFFGVNDIFNHLTFIPIVGLPNLKHSRIGGDGQVGNANCGLRSIPGASDERTFIEALGGFPSTQIKGDGGGLDRDSDWNGDDGQPLNKLWDTHTDVFNNNLAGQIGYRVRYQTNGDGIVWVVHILGVR
jgi:hypothetical protein